MNNKASDHILVRHYQYVPPTSVGAEKVTLQNSRTSKSMERNSEVRSEIEKVIMELMNLQDDLIEKYCSVEAPARRTRRDVWEMHRRFTIIVSALRRLKKDFIPTVASHLDDVG